MLQLNHNEPSSSEERDFSSRTASPFLAALSAPGPWSSHSCRDSSRSCLWCLHSAALFIMQEQIPFVPAAFQPGSSSCISPLISVLSQWECNFPTCSDFTLIHLPLHLGHSDTTPETSSVEVFVPLSAPGFTRCENELMERCPALLPALVPLAQQCLGFRGDLAPNSGAHLSSLHKHLCWFKARGGVRC